MTGRDHLMSLGLACAVALISAQTPRAAAGQVSPDVEVNNLSLAQELSQGQRAPSGDIQWETGTSLFTGAASATFPIELPRGPGGFGPILSVDYNSSRKWGALGPGWDLSLPKITRSTRYGARVAQTPDLDAAIFEYGGQELVRDPDGLRKDPFGCLGVRYHTRTENDRLILHVRPDQLDCPVRDYWVVVDKDGAFATFGRSDYCVDTGSFCSRVDGIDAVGEYLMDARYSRRTGTAWVVHHDSGRRPSEIHYPVVWDEDPASVYQDVVLMETPGGARSVILDWSKNDVVNPEYYASGRTALPYGLPKVTDHHLIGITVFYQDEVVREYWFEYDAVPHTGPFVLRQVVEAGADGRTYNGKTRSLGAGALTDAIVAYRFTYGFDHNDPVRPGFDELTPPSAGSFYHREREYTQPELRGAVTSDVVDLNGDGVPDLVRSSTSTEQGSGWSVQFGRPDGTFGASTDWEGAPYHLTTPTKIDRHGDVREHSETVPDDDYWELAPGTGGLLDGPTRAMLIDMNGDGLPDMFSGSSLYLNVGDRFVRRPWDQTNFPTPDQVNIWSCGTTCEITPSHWDGIVHNIKGFVVRTLRDMDGDGCPDLLTSRHPKRIEWHPDRKCDPEKVSEDTCEPAVIFEASESPPAGPAWLWWRNRMCDPAPALGFEPAAEWALPDTIGALEFTSSWPGAYKKRQALIEVNGDGVPDLFRSGDVFLGTGRGFEPTRHEAYSAGSGRKGGGWQGR